MACGHIVLNEMSHNLTADWCNFYTPNLVLKGRVLTPIEQFYIKH